MQTANQKSVHSVALPIAFLLTLVCQNLEAQFINVINVPPDQAPPQIGSDTQLNLGEGGLIENSLIAGATDGTSRNVEVNVTGGTIGGRLIAYRGATVNVSDGSVGGLEARFDSVASITGGSIDGTTTVLGRAVVDVTGGALGTLSIESLSEINFTGGSFGRVQSAFDSSLWSLFGGEFELNGQPVAAGRYVVGREDALTGTLADGTPFAFASRLGGYHVNIVDAAVPALGTTPIILAGPDAPSPAGLRVGQSLTATDGVVLPRNFTAVRATLAATDTAIKRSYKSVRSTGDFSRVVVGDESRPPLNQTLLHTSDTTFTDSTIYDDLFIVAGTTEFTGTHLYELVETADGANVAFRDTVAESVVIGRSNSRFFVEGGTFKRGIVLESGSEAEILSGSSSNQQGTISAFSLRIDENSHAEVRGGTFLNGVSIAGTARLSGGTFESIGSTNGGLTVVGGDFRLNNQALDASMVSTTLGDVFSGVLADGSVLVMPIPPNGNSPPSPALNAFRLEQVVLPDADLTPLLVDDESDEVPRGLRPGQSLTVEGTAQLGHNFGLVDATITIRGGSIGENFRALNSEVHIEGGAFDRSFALYQSDSNISGGTLSGLTATGGQISIPSNSTAILGGLGVVDATATIAGGQITGGILFSNADAQVSGGTVNDELSLRDGAAVIISGGTFSDRITMFDSRLEVTDGSFSSILAWTDAELAVHGGTIGSVSHWTRNETIITGGDIGRLSTSLQSGPLTIEGGAFGEIEGGGQVNISGGSLGDFASGTDTTLFGGQFKVNGVAVTEGTVTLAPGETLSGVLADGSVFIFGTNQSLRGVQLQSDRVLGVTLEAAPLPTAQSIPFVISGPNDTAPQGLREGQTLTLLGSGVLPHSFAVVESSLTMVGGTTESHVELIDSQMNLTSGTVGGDLRLYSDSDFAMSGGLVSGHLVVHADSTAELSGGSIGQSVIALERSTLSLVGTTFSIDGVPLELAIGDTLDLGELSGILTGFLADGSAVSLRNLFRGMTDYIDPLATLTVSLVAPLLPGDFNADGVVDSADYTAWRDQVGTAGTLPNDIDGGTIGQAQYDTWRANFGATINQSLAVPEPSAALIALVAIGVTAGGIAGSSRGMEEASRRPLLGKPGAALEPHNKT